MRWMGRMRSVTKEHQLEPKLAQNREAWRYAEKCSHNDRPRKGIRSEKVSNDSKVLLRMYLIIFTGIKSNFR